MPLHIIGKYQCNGYDFSNNKEKKVIIKKDTKEVAKEYKDIGIIQLKPIIDRLQFDFFLTQEFVNKFDKNLDVQEYRDWIKGSLFGSAKSDPDSGISLVENVPFKTSKFKHYNVHLFYTPPGSKHSILMQVGPKTESDKWPFMRFDMKRCLFSVSEMVSFQQFIEGLLVIPGVDVPFEDFAIWTKIRCLEIAVDMPGLRSSRVEAFDNKAGVPYPKKTHVYKSKTGRAETLYLNATAVKTSQIRLYDKQAEQIEQGVAPENFEFFCTRCEFRVTDTTPYKLMGLHNRFKRISLRALNKEKLNTLPFLNQTVIRLALHETIQKAVTNAPEEIKKQLIADYHSCLTNVWDADLLWTHWKEIVVTSGLLPLPKCTQVQMAA